MQGRPGQPDSKDHTVLSLPPSLLPPRPSSQQSRLIRCYLIREERRRENKTEKKEEKKKKPNFITGTNAKGLVSFIQRKVGPIKKNPTTLSS